MSSEYYACMRVNNLHLQVYFSWLYMLVCVTNFLVCCTLVHAHYRDFVLYHLYQQNDYGWGEMQVMLL